MAKQSDIPKRTKKRARKKLAPQIGGNLGSWRCGAVDFCVIGCVTVTVGCWSYRGGFRGVMRVASQARGTDDRRRRGFEKKKKRNVFVSEEAFTVGMSSSSSFLLLALLECL